MLHALAGNGEGGESLRNLRCRQELSLEALEKANRQVAGARNGKPVFLTGKNTELCSIPLTARHFFGRERELFELREMLAQGGRYLVSGIGGIGKTELMRQFIKCCVEERLVDYICTVQYENSLEDSLIKAFPEVRGMDRQNNFREALTRIRAHAGAGILLVIDNMNCGQEEQGWESFCELPATIFVTACSAVHLLQPRIPILSFQRYMGLPLFKPVQQELQRVLSVIYSAAQKLSGSLREEYLQLLLFLQTSSPFSHQAKLPSKSPSCAKDSVRIPQAHILLSKSRLHKGEEDYGVPQLMEACKIGKIIFSTAERVDYATCLTELAMAYNKAGCREEACEYYKKVLDIYDTVEGGCLKPLLRFLLPQSCFCIRHLGMRIPIKLLQKLRQWEEKLKNCEKINQGRESEILRRRQQIEAETALCRQAVNPDKRHICWQAQLPVPQQNHSGCFPESLPPSG